MFFRARKIANRLSGGKVMHCVRISLHQLESQLKKGTRLTRASPPPPTPPLQLSTYKSKYASISVRRSRAAKTTSAIEQLILPIVSIAMLVVSFGFQVGMFFFSLRHRRRRRRRLPQSIIH